MQTGFGSFVTVYLVKNQWPPEAIGFALTIATLSSLVSQIPAGAAVLPGIAGVGLAALLLCLTAARPVVYLALSVQDLASSLIGLGLQRSAGRRRLRREQEGPDLGVGVQCPGGHHQHPDAGGLVGGASQSLHSPSPLVY